MRQINDAIRYAPVSARYKVYILDEVHMLSGAAFNALLKTLEEPPPHAKFIFATTEIRKVPVTVLSRCQRFDLRRVDAALLVKHLEGIAAKEKIEAEPAALALIARAAEGSVRDSLSLFDQAIAHAAGPVRAEDVRQMLGLADRVRIVDLFEALMKGDVAAALKELREQYDIGADPAVVLGDLAEFTHFVTRVKVVPAVADDVSLSEAERVRGRAFADGPVDARAVAHLADAAQGRRRGAGRRGRPVAAAEMVLVRIAYAADLPTPDEVVRSLERGGAARRAPARQWRRGTAQRRRRASRRATTRRAARRARPPRCRRGWPTIRSPRCMSRQPPRRRSPSARSRQLIALAAGEARHHDEDGAGTRRAAGALRGRPARDRARGERAEDAGARPAAQAHRLDRQALDGGGVAGAGRRRPCARRRTSAQAELERGVQSDPLVQAVLKRFPGAKIVGVTQNGAGRRRRAARRRLAEDEE